MQASTQTPAGRPRAGEIVIRPLGEVMGAEVIGADLAGRCPRASTSSTS